MADYESLAHLSRWRRLLVAALAMALPISAASQQPTDAGVLYRCMDANGVANYTSKPSPGCVVISLYRARAPRPAETPAPRTYSCTSDCSGHRAGYEWARSRRLADPNQCSGNSNSFIEGCRAFTEGHPGF